MTAHEAIRSMLLASTSVVAACKDRIRPDRLAQTDALPAIVISITATNASWSLAGSEQGITYSGAVQVYTEHREDADDLAMDVFHCDGKTQEDDGATWHLFCDPPTGTALLQETETDRPIYQATVGFTLVKT